MPQADKNPRELDYILLLFALFVVPRFLQRYRLPSAVTSVALGMLAGMGLGLFLQDRTVGLMATLGIVSLFLFLGLDVDFPQLRSEAPVLVQHMAIGVGALAGVATLVHYAVGLDWRPSLLTALALLTPSTGFILDSLASLDLTDGERFWVKTKAVATELVALAVLFVTLQSTTARSLATSTLLLVVMIMVLPLAFRLFAVRIVPFAPKSEFAFLLMVAVLCAFVTRWLGVYYLVGAFVVGITAQRFREHLPAFASEQQLHAVEVFASFFIPFYFFNAGLHVRQEDFGTDALLMSLVFLMVIVPFRIALVAVHRRLALRESYAKGIRIGVAMAPSLIFTLVIAEILQDRFDVPRSVFSGLVIYSLANTLIPGFALRLPAPELHLTTTSRFGTGQPGPGPE